PSPQPSRLLRSLPPDQPPCGPLTASRWSYPEFLNEPIFDRSARMTQATAPEGYPRSLYTLLMPRESPGLFPTHSNAPDSYLVAYIDGGARGNPGPAGYGAFIKDQSG